MYHCITNNIQEFVVNGDIIWFERIYHQQVCVYVYIYIYRWYDGEKNKEFSNKWMMGIWWKYTEIYNLHNYFDQMGWVWKLWLYLQQDW